MNREEAIRKVIGCLTDYFPMEDYGEVEEIIKALKQESCEDAISREAVLAIAGDSCLDLDSEEQNKTKTKPIDKIRFEIENLEEGITSYHNDRPWVYKDEVLQIIDKYKAENEDDE